MSAVYRIRYSNGDGTPGAYRNGLLETKWECRNASLAMEQAAKIAFLSGLPVFLEYAGRLVLRVLPDGSSLPVEETRDARWDHGMDGWRVRVYDPPGGSWDLEGAVGEVTGYGPDGYFVYVVLDGETELREFRWHEVRPA